MSRIRSLRIDDIPDLVRIHRRAFARESNLDAADLAAEFRTVFLENPWTDGHVPSLVYEGHHGRPGAFLGVFVVPWRFEGLACSVAITSQLMVDPEEADATTAIRLLRKVFAGGYDIVLTDGATGRVRDIWDRLGGDTLWTSSMQWVRPLRPLAHLVQAGGQRLPPALARLLRLATKLPDMLAARLRPNRFQSPLPEMQSEELTVESLRDAWRHVEPEAALGPDYDDVGLQWLFDRFAERRRHGRLRGVLLRDSKGQPVGWYLYYRYPGQAAHVIQVSARPAQTEAVFRHLFRDAWAGGATALVGQLEARHIPALAELWCYFRRGTWCLVFSPRSELREALHSGAARLTRFDGEFWMRFIGG